MPITSDKALRALHKGMLIRATVWAIGCLLLSALWQPMSFPILLELLLGALLLSSGVVLIIWMNVTLFRSRGQDNVARIVLALLLSVWFWFYIDAGTTFRWIFFQRPDYEQKILQLQQLTGSQQDEFCQENHCTVDASQGAWRVCFTEDPGGLGNYGGVVYDPTGDVMTANTKNRDGTVIDRVRIHRIRELFHGYLQDATPLGGPWFRCDFGN